MHSNHISQVNFIVSSSVKLVLVRDGQSRRCRDKEDVARIQEYLSARCQDPFDVAEVPVTSRVHGQLKLYLNLLNG